MSFPRLSPIPININVPTTNAGTSDTFGGPLMPFAGEVVAVQVTNGATAAADPTNYTTVAVKNGSTTVASHATTSTGFTADTAKSLTLSTTNANRKFASGDQLNFTKTESGTGLALTAPCTVTIWVVFGYEN